MNDDNRLLDVISEQSNQIDILSNTVRKLWHTVVGLIGVIVSLIFLLIVT